jgi:hypothetical protein
VRNVFCAKKGQMLAHTFRSSRFTSEIKMRRQGLEPRTR